MLNNLRGSFMKRSFLLGSAVVMLAGSAYAQQPGVYRGRTSQQMDIQFTVTGAGCVDPMSFAVTLTCPSGTRTSWGAFFGGLCNPIEEGSFTVTLAPVDGAIPTYVVSGSFDSETSAAGEISFQASHLYVVSGKDLGAQLCDSGKVTWTAQLGAGASEPVSSDGNQVISGNSGTQVRLSK